MKSVLGYVAPWSVAPGERLGLHVGLRSGAREYATRVMRVICADLSEAGPGPDLRPMPCALDGTRPGVARGIGIGSYAEARLSARFDRGLTLGAFIRPTIAGRTQTVLALAGGERVALAIGDDGTLVFHAGDARIATREAIPLREWSFVHGAWAPDGRLLVGFHALGTLFDHVGDAIGAGIPGTLQAPVVRIASGFDGACFDGKIERPFVAHGALETAARAAVADGAMPDSLAALWDGTPGGDVDVLPDLGPEAAHAVTRNLPARAVKGVRWTGEWHDWRARPDHYAAVEYHDDDLDDAAWPEDAALTIPADWPSGVYAVELRAAGDTTHIPFFVRPPRDRATAPLAFIASTFTSIAYANYRFHMWVPADEAALGATPRLRDSDVYLWENADVGLSLYDTHADGAGVRYATRHRPILNMGPTEEVWNLSEDTLLLAWLDRLGQPVDIVTDEDLHAEGAALLGRYRTVIAGSHPEYMTTPMWDAFHAYLRGGGRLMALGGNGFYWRIAAHPARPGVIELRRAEGGGRFWAEEPGEHHMAFTGELGGLWRRSGRTPNALMGLSTRGIGFDASSYYVRTGAARDPRAAFIFEGIGEDARIGDAGLLGGGAAGWEIDAADATLGTPAHALVVARSELHTRGILAMPEESLMPFAGRTGATDPSIRADMIFFETPRGGAVFAVGSMAWLGALPCGGWDNAVARLTGNVLRRFLDPAPFPPPP